MSSNFEITKANSTVERLSSNGEKLVTMHDLLKARQTIASIAGLIGVPLSPEQASSSINDLLDALAILGNQAIFPKEVVRFPATLVQETKSFVNADSVERNKDDSLVFHRPSSYGKLIISDDSGDIPDKAWQHIKNLEQGDEENETV